jgi:hypothetical protein
VVAVGDKFEVGERRREFLEGFELPVARIQLQ